MTALDVQTLETDDRDSDSVVESSGQLRCAADVADLHIHVAGDEPIWWRAV